MLGQGVTITKAAKMLHVKRPTAKIIIKRFQNHGTYFHKKMPAYPTKNYTQGADESKVDQLSFQIALPNQ